MQTTAERIDWLERQLVQVSQFIARDRELLEKSPDSLSIQLSLRSWESLHAEHTRDLDLLRNAKVRR